MWAAAAALTQPLAWELLYVTDAAIKRKNNKKWSSLVAQQVKDLALSLLWCRFDPWPGNFHMPWAWPKKEKEKEKKQIGTRKLKLMALGYHKGWKTALAVR